MEPSPRHVAIIGGGLAGLAAAHELMRAGRAVTVFEAADRPGGQIHTEPHRGFLVEHGAEGFTPSDDAVEILSTLGLADHIVPQQVTRTLGLDEVTASLTVLSPGEAGALLDLRIGDKERGKGIVTLPTGMGELVTTLAGAIADRAEICLSCPVTYLERRSATWHLETQDRRNVAADDVIIALPPAQAARLIAPLDTRAGGHLDGLPTLGSVTVSLAFLRSNVAHPLDATGFVVTGGPREAEGLKACTFTSSKFPGRAPEGWVQLRAFYRPGARHTVESDDTTWVDRAAGDLTHALGISGQPEHAWVARWPRALPQYGRGHVEWSDELACRLRELGPIELAGASFSGVGIGAALSSGRQAARRLANN